MCLRGGEKTPPSYRLPTAQSLGRKRDEKKAIGAERRGDSRGREVGGAFCFFSSPSFFRLLNKATRSEKKKVKVTDQEICQAPLIFISPALEWRRPSRRLPLEERQSERPPELPAVSRATPSIHTSFLPTHFLAFRLCTIFLSFFSWNFRCADAPLSCQGHRDGDTR